MDTNAKKLGIFWIILLIGVITTNVFGYSAREIAIFGLILWILGAIGTNFYLGKYFITTKNRTTAILILIPTVLLAGIVLGFICFVIGNQLEKRQVNKPNTTPHA
jgi:hypothetical protein